MITLFDMYKAECKEKAKRTHVLEAALSELAEWAPVYGREKDVLTLGYFRRAKRMEKDDG